MLNFMKGSIFSRKQAEPVPEEPEKDVQVLAVWERSKLNRFDMQRG